VIEQFIVILDMIDDKNLKNKEEIKRKLREEFENMIDGDIYASSTLTLIRRDDD
jgi:hypothetical protein